MCCWDMCLEHCWKSRRSKEAIGWLLLILSVTERQLSIRESNGQWRASRALQATMQFVCTWQEFRRCTFLWPLQRTWMTSKSFPAFGDGPLCGKIKKGKSQTVPQHFLSLYLWHRHGDFGSDSGRVEAGKGVSALTLGHVWHRRVGWVMCTREACCDRIWGCLIGEQFNLGSVLWKPSIDAIGINWEQSKDYCIKVTGLTGKTN